MQRRSFLKTLAAFAATAVVGPSLAALAPDDMQKLIEQMKTGRVSGQRFLLRKPVVFEVDNLAMDDCEFIFDFKEPANSAIEITGKNVSIISCHLTTGKSKVNSVIKLSHDSRCVLMNNALRTHVDGAGLVIDAWAMGRQG